MTAFIRKFNLCSFKISFSSYVSFTIYGCNSDFVLLYGEFEAKKKMYDVIIAYHKVICASFSLICNLLPVTFVWKLVLFWRWYISNDADVFTYWCKQPVSFEIWGSLLKWFLTVFWFAEGSGKQLWCNTWREENCLEDDIYSVLVY